MIIRGHRSILALTGIVLSLIFAALVVHSCGIYSFTGTSIQPDVKTVTINYFEYKALKVNPTLSNSLTESLKDKFRKMTRLEQVDMDGDLEITGSVTGYDVRAMAVTANEVAAQNRLTVTVRIDFTNRKYPEDDFQGKSFSAYADYDSTQSLDAVESTLCDEIIEKICEDIFNATVANW
uniref:LptE family protein n=1 Tax=Candidatus Cryptobacteroides bacterium TaxID=3085639 RepID=UPI0040250124